jgi:hypothetical protein
LLASAVTDWIGLVLTAVFGSLVVLQLIDIKKQTRQSALANVSESYGAISEGMASFRRSLSQEPDWSRYFFEGADPDDADDPRNAELDDDDHIQLDLVCDEIVDLADTVIEQRHTVPGAEMDWSTWDAYLRSIYQNSPLLRRYLRENNEFYPDYVLTVFGYIIVRDEDTDDTGKVRSIGKVQSEWRVDEWPSDQTEGQDQERLETAFKECATALKEGTREVASDPQEKGYPWFRTWVITKLGEEGEKGAESAVRGPRLVAVTRPGTDPETAEVSFAWCRSEAGADAENEKKVQDDSERVLWSWVCEVLRASTLLTKAKVVHPQTEPHEVRFESRWVALRNRLTPWHQKRTRECYLAPLAPIRRRPERRDSNAPT